MKKFVNKSKFDVLVMKSSDQEQSTILQKVVFDYGFFWSGHRQHEIYEIPNFHYIYVILDTQKLLYSGGEFLPNDEPDMIFLKDHKWDKKVYTIQNLYLINDFLKNGMFSPNYNPKKINRSI